ncbi:hemerythrin domain-containing protein [Methylobacterium symbioticum]|uniref:Hemerythrin-like domain-containing protein n=1 Tax=Methylobacterium symbioticum TaxID=2584084 RepID=A0A509EGR7_9HYPH|nr:hemerythrin domain-containing protein [Methylobacterium symbioticum]VUD73350.1 hypothetical protein MET9862_03965 [Methylobacterium symbioticum]
MDIWHFIERDHANIAYLIHEMPAALPGADVLRSRSRLLADLIDELDRHAKALSGSLYPVLRRDPGTERLIADLAAEEAEFMRALRRLQRQRTDSRGWLDRFADATYAVDRWLHRHRHELVPAARARLFGPDLDRTGDAFIRARRRLLNERGSGFPGHLRKAGAVVALTSAVALLIWRLGAADRHRGAGQPVPAKRADGAAPQPPRERGEDLRERQERLLDEAIEETFPASDPIAPSRITR